MSCNSLYRDGGASQELAHTGAGAVMRIEGKVVRGHGVASEGSIGLDDAVRVCGRWSAVWYVSSSSELAMESRTTRAEACQCDCTCVCALCVLFAAHASTTIKGVNIFF